MSLVQDNFRSNILWSSTDGKCSSLIQYLGESKIGELQITIIGDEEILRLQISKDDIFIMEIFETTGHCGTIEPCLVSCKWLNGSQVSEKLSSIDQFQN